MDDHIAAHVQQAMAVIETWKEDSSIRIVDITYEIDGQRLAELPEDIAQPFFRTGAMSVTITALNTELAEAFYKEFCQRVDATREDHG